MEVVYEDNHLIVVNKAAGEIVQGDKTGDKPLSEMVKDYLREKYNKPGNVFCGVIHRPGERACRIRQNKQSVGADERDFSESESEKNILGNLKKFAAKSGRYVG